MNKLLIKNSFLILKFKQNEFLCDYCENKSSNFFLIINTPACKLQASLCYKHAIKIQLSDYYRHKDWISISFIRFLKIWKQKGIIGDDAVKYIINEAEKNLNKLLKK